MPTSPNPNNLMPVTDETQRRKVDALVERYLPTRDRVATDVIERLGWSVMLFPELLERRRIEWLLQAVTRLKTQTGWIVDEPSSDASIFLTTFREDDLFDFAAMGGLDETLMLGADGEFLLYQNRAYHLVAGPDAFVETVTGCRPETAWCKFESYIRRVEFDEEGRRETWRELVKHYEPHLGVERDALRCAPPDTSLETLLEPIESTGEQEGRLDDVVDHLVDGAYFDVEWVKSKQWVAGPVDGVHTPDPYAWADRAEWLAEAIDKLGVERLTAASPHPRRHQTYEVPVSRDGLLGFQAKSRDRHMLLLPEPFKFVVLGSPRNYFVIAGPPTFVRRAVGNSFPVAMEDFLEFGERQAHLKSDAENHLGLVLLVNEKCEETMPGLRV